MTERANHEVDSADSEDSHTETPTVGIIGLGNMGAPIARCLAPSFDTVAYDLDTDRLDAVIDAGVTAVDSSAAVGERADVVLLSLPSTEAVESVALGDEGVLVGLSAGDALVDTSTIDPDVTDAVAAACDDTGVSFLDAPVSGGPRNAKRGSLTTMVGSDSETLDRLRPVFDCYCDTVYHVGHGGSGVAMKVVNNYMFAVNSAVTFEALAMARRAGIDDETFFQVASQSSGDSYALRRNVERFVLPGTYDAEADLSIVTKDVTLAEGFGRALGVPMPVGGSTSAVYRLAEMQGLADYDLAALLAVYDSDEHLDGS